MGDIKKYDLLKISFKHELDDIVQNSPLKESINSCRSKGIMKFDKYYSTKTRESLKGNNKIERKNFTFTS